MIVTGPSFAISTVMRAPNTPVSTWQAQPAQRGAEGLVESLGLLGRRGPRKARPVPFLGVGDERELADDEHCTAHVLRRCGRTCPPRSRRSAGGRPFRPAAPRLPAGHPGRRRAGRRARDRSRPPPDRRRVLALPTRAGRPRAWPTTGRGCGRCSALCPARARPPACSDRWPRRPCPASRGPARARSGRSRR